MRAPLISIICVFSLLLTIVTDISSVSQRHFPTSSASGEGVGGNRCRSSFNSRELLRYAAAHRFKDVPSDAPSHVNGRTSDECNNKRACIREHTQHVFIRGKRLHFSDISVLGNRVQSNNTTTITLNAARRILLISSVLYGLDYPLMKSAQETISPDIFTAIRHIAALLYLLPLTPRCWHLFKSQPSLSWRSMRIGLEVGFWTGTAAVAQAFALQYTPAGKVAFIGALAVVMPQLFDWCNSLLTYQSISNTEPDDGQCIAPNGGCPMNKTCSSTSTDGLLRRIICSPLFAPILALTGTAVLETEDIFGGSGMWKGVVLSLVAPFAFALSSWRSEKAGRYAKYDTDTCSLMVLLVVATMSFAVCFFNATENGFHNSISNSTFVKIGQEWLNALQLLAADWKLSVIAFTTGCVSIGWTTRSEQQVLQVISANEAVLLLSTEPIFAAAASRVLLGERMGVESIIAGALILLSCIWNDVMDKLSGEVVSSDYN